MSLSEAQETRRAWLPFALLAVVVVAVGVVMIAAMLWGVGGWGPWGGGGYYGPMMGGMGFGTWVVVIMMIVVVLAFLLVGLGAVALLTERDRAVGVPRNPPPPPSNEALEVVRNRYARGELSAEQYRAMVRDLQAA